jgi:hypothetical protein
MPCVYIYIYIYKGENPIHLYILYTISVCSAAIVHHVLCFKTLRLRSIYLVYDPFGRSRARNVGDYIFFPFARGKLRRPMSGGAKNDGYVRSVSWFRSVRRVMDVIKVIVAHAPRHGNTRSAAHAHASYYVVRAHERINRG